MWTCRERSAMLLLLWHALLERLMLVVYPQAVINYNDIIPRLRRSRMRLSRTLHEFAYSVNSVKVLPLFILLMTIFSLTVCLSSTTTNFNTNPCLIVASTSPSSPTHSHSDVVVIVVSLRRHRVSLRAMKKREQQIVVLYA